MAVRLVSAAGARGQRVLPDTSAWIAFFSPRGHDSLKAAVRAALDEERVATCAVVRAEILVGARDRGAYRKLDLLLQSLPQVPIDDEVWRRAATLGFTLRREGRSTPLTDLLIAEACRAESLELWHLDEHYETIRAHSGVVTRSFLEPRGRTTAR